MAVNSLHKESHPVCFFRREGLGSSLGKAFTADAQLKSSGGSPESSQKEHSSDKNGSKLFVKPNLIIKEHVQNKKLKKPANEGVHCIPQKRLNKLYFTVHKQHDKTAFSLFSE